MKLTYTGPAEVLEAIAALGRTEDVSWSPDGRRLVLAAIVLDKLLIVGVRPGGGAGGKSLCLTDAVELASDSLHRPHGVCWVDDATIAVASREGSVSLFRAPPAQGLVSRHGVQPLAVIGRNESELLKTPGSLCSRELGGGLCELWVCNGFVHYVTHHLLDSRAGFAHRDAQVLMQQGLEVPDGIALDAAGDWVAVSNHDRHCVALYANDEHLQARNAPAAALRGVNYPHGLCFVSQGRYLLVADAGTPHVAVFRRGSDGWKDQAEPEVLVRVLDETVFRRGHHNPREGGPKGIDVHEALGLLVTTCVEQPLAFFDLSAILPADTQAGQARDASSRQGTPTDRLRVVALRMARDVAAREEAVTAAVRHELTLMRASGSWRITAPLRSLVGAWLRWRSRPRKG